MSSPALALDTALPATSKLEQFTKDGLSLIGGGDTAKEIGITTGVSALWAVGSHLTETTFKDASPNVKRLLNAVFGVPVASRIIIPDLIESWKERDVPDFVMAALTAAIATLGVATNDKEFITSASMLAALFGISGHLEDGVEGAGEEKINELEASVPATARIREKQPDGSYLIREIPREEIKAGDEVIVDAMSAFPVDGSVIEVNGIAGKDGVIQFDRSFKGEEGAVEIPYGEQVPQGAHAAEGNSFVIRAARPASESTILRNVELIRNAPKSKTETKIEGLVDNVYVPILVAAAGAQFVWSFIQDRKKHEGNRDKPHTDDTSKGHFPGEVDHTLWHSVRKALTRTAELAIKMAPCAITAAMLVTKFTKFRLSSLFGVHVRDDGALEKLPQSDTILTDVRGTLTRGYLDVEDITPVGASRLSAKELTEICATAESTSNHAFAKAFLRKAADQDIAVTVQPTDIINASPTGVDATIRDGLRVSIGNADYMKKHADAVVPDEVKAAMQAKNAEGYSTSLIRIAHADGQIEWAFATASDPLREGVKEAITDLRKQGKTIVLMTGMPEEEAQFIRAKLDDPSITANPILVRSNLRLLEQDGEAGKDTVIEEFHAKGGKLIAIGDAANDAPAMVLVREKGGVSLAVSTRDGSPTEEVASIVINGVHQLPGLMQLSKNLQNTLKANLGAAVGWMSFLIGSHVFGLEMKPQLASIAHETPTVLETLASVVEGLNLTKLVPGPVYNAEALPQLAAQQSLAATHQI